MNAKAMVCFRNVDKTENVLSLIDGKAAKLHRIDPRVLRCRVIVERPHGAQRSSSGCRVLVIAAVPGSEVVGRAEGQGDGEEAVTLALHEAFRAVERRLAERSARQIPVRKPALRQRWIDAA